MRNAVFVLNPTLLGRLALIFGLGFTVPAMAQGNLQKSFEQSYVQLQQKLETLKKKGGKVSAQAEQEMNDLLAQMNHQHAEIKRELELKNQQLAQKLDEGRKTMQEDWTSRLTRSLSELGAGIERAWLQLKTPGKDKP